MIVYVSTRKHAYTLGVQLHFFPGRLGEAVRLVPYESLYSLAELPAATYIFTDFDRLSDDGVERAAHLADELARVGLPVLNHPRRALLRFDLLRRLFERGINDFNVHRLADWREVERFPAFIRRAGDHKGPLTEPLGDRAALAAAATRLAGHRHADDMMIVEFVDTRYPDGFYRKFGAQRVGDRIFVQHVYITLDWRSKGVPDKYSEAHWAEATAFVRDNPHAEQLREVFEMASIEYGRADYGLRDGRIQVFEINTNPTILNHPAMNTLGLDQQKFATAHEEAMLPVDRVRGARAPMPAALRNRAGRRRSLEAIHRATLVVTLRRLNFTFARKRAAGTIREFVNRWVRPR